MSLKDDLAVIMNPAPGVQLVSQGWVKGSCDWKRDEDGVDHSDCGHSFVFDDAGNPSEHGFKWCPFCRKPLVSVEAGR